MKPGGKKALTVKDVMAFVQTLPETRRLEFFRQLAQEFSVTFGVVAKEKQLK